MNELTHLKEWFKLSDATKLGIFQETARNIGLKSMAIEKDWWVVHTLAIIFNMESSSALLFKGGTSLSKGWNLIERFSEDIEKSILALRVNLQREKYAN